MNQGTRIVVALLVLLLVVTGIYWIATGPSKTRPASGGESTESVSQPTSASPGGPESRSSTRDRATSAAQPSGGRPTGSETAPSGAGREDRPGALSFGGGSADTSRPSAGRTPRLDAPAGTAGSTAPDQFDGPASGEAGRGSRFGDEIGGKGDLPAIENFSRRPVGPLPSLANMPAGFVPAQPRGVALDGSSASDGPSSSPPGAAQPVRSDPTREPAREPTREAVRETSGAAPTGPRSEPAGGAGSPARSAAETPSSSGGQEEYVIREGDTLTIIADMWFGDGRRWPAILAVNEGVDPARLRIGQRIKLPPREAAAAPAARTSGSGAATGAGGGVDSRGTHLVQEGDTLYSIAKARLGDGTRWEEIYAANKAVIGEDPKRLKVGIRLVVPR